MPSPVGMRWYCAAVLVFVGVRAPHYRSSRTESTKTKYAQRLVPTMLVVQDGALRKGRRWEAMPGDRAYCRCGSSPEKGPFCSAFVVCNDMSIIAIQSS